MVQRRKKRETTSPEKIAKFATAARECKSSVEAAIRCGFTTKDASDDDKARGANSWESTYSTMRRQMVEKLVSQGAPQSAADALALKKMPASAWGGAVSKSVADVYGLSAEELKALGIKANK